MLNLPSCLVKVSKEQESTTGFDIYGSTISHEPDPIFAPISFEFDLAHQRGRVEVTGVLKAVLEPIRNPVTGEVHRAVIKLPHGFEFREAEMASSTFQSSGAIEQTYAGCYGFVTVVTYGPYGIVDHESYPRVET